MSFNIDFFTQELRTRKEYIENCLEKFLGDESRNPVLIHQAMHYAVLNGGKRLRPIMVLEGARIAGGKVESVIPTACAIEMIHSYSLVHDDLPAMDDDDFRRGQPTCHKVFGEANAILTGDALLTGAFEVMADNALIDGIELKDVVRVIREVAHAAGSQGMIGGQVLDLAGEDQTVAYFLSVLHGLKTGELFKASLRAGAILNRMDEAGLEALTQFGHNFGLAFQITDDILDVTGDQSLIGKPVGSDEKNVRTTYISLFGVEGAKEKAQESVQACLESLAVFGSEADFLRDLAWFTLYRTS
ncbi:MAG: geranyl transferase [Firmicutes bacterium HGW-Firmicutes-15]|nr:MAG: geranyl transferase [Firmicutes bacterium HGW-Firmicutes-15]